MGWLITLGILTLLAVLPLGVSVRYNAEGPLVRVILGPVKLKVFPASPKKKPKKEKKKEKPSGEQEPAKQTKPLPEPPQPPKPEKGKDDKTGGSLLDFIPLVKLGINFLGDFRRKLRINNLQLKLILAGGDPCDLAVNYGKTWAGVSNLMPMLERWFVIKKRDIEVECDFTTSETLVYACLDLTITLGRIISMVVVYAVRALIAYLKIKKKRKGGAVT